jgi:secondary thiamine-phosphate synthase enzyme
MQFKSRQIAVDTDPGIGIYDMTPRLRELLAGSGIRNGFCIVSSRHTTTALAINEHEARLLEDIRIFLERLVPADAGYKHNDIHLRDCDPDEPENAHSHIMAMLLGSSEAIPVVDGELALGTWQSLLFFDLDGPRSRILNVQLVGE